MDQYLNELLSPYHERKSLRWSVRAESRAGLLVEKSKVNVWDEDKCLMSWSTSRDENQVLDIKATLNSACFGRDELVGAVFSSWAGIDGRSDYFYEVVVFRQHGHSDYLSMSGLGLKWMDHPLAPKLQGSQLFIRNYEAGIAILTEQKQIVVSTHEVWKDSEIAQNIKLWLEVHVSPTDPAVAPAILVAMLQLHLL